MRVLRVQYRGRVFYGALYDEGVQCLNKDLGLTGRIPLQELQVLPPVAPTKVICLGVNYKKHAEEMGKEPPDEPLLFFKPPSAVIGGGQAIVLPGMSERVDYEGELAVVIGKAGRHIALEDAPQHIFGLCCANDVTARDLQKKDGLYARAKGFDTFLPIGPWIETEIRDINDITLRTKVNGVVKQEASTSDMAFSPFETVRFVSQIMTLNPGDVILTGTPSGVGPLLPGDEVMVEIDEVGVLINPVVGAVIEDKATTGPIQ